MFFVMYCVYIIEYIYIIRCRYNYIIYIIICIYNYSIYICKYKYYIEYYIYYI